MRFAFDDLKGWSARSAPWLYGLFCLVYAALIATNTSFLSPLEDLGLVEMFRNREWYGIANSRLIMGRFNVLLGLDIYVLQCLHTAMPLTDSVIGVRSFYVFIAGFFCFAAYASHRVIALKVKDHWRMVAYLMMVVLFLSPIFVSIHFRLLFSERYLFAVFLLTILCLYRYEQHRSYGWIIAVVLVSNIGIQLKEVAFLSYACMGIFYISRYRASQEKDRKDGLLGLLLVVSCILYLLMFALLILPHMSDMYGSRNLPYIQLWATTIYRWSFTHPFLVFLFVPISLVGLYRNLRRRKISVWTDALNVAGLAYMFSYPLLNLFPNEYYLAPVYAFALFAIAGAVGSADIRNLRIFRIVLAGCFLLQLNGVLFGVNDIIFQKYNNRNFYSMMDALEEQLHSPEAEDTSGLTPVVFVVDCLTFGASGIISYPLGSLASEWDIPVDWKGFCQRELTPPDVPAEEDRPHRGDFLVYTPYAQVNLSEFNQEYLAEVSRFPAPSWLQTHNLPVFVKARLGCRPVLYNEVAFNGTYAIYRYQ